MAGNNNQDNRVQKTIWDFIPLFVMVGSMITAWVNLNGELAQVKLAQEYSEKYNTVKYDELQKSIDGVNTKLSAIKTSNRDIKEQMTDMERTVTLMYSKRK